MRYVIAPILLISASVVLCGLRASAAACPMAIQNLVLAGKGMSGSEAMYRIDATIGADHVTSAKLTLWTANGPSPITWPEIAQNRTSQPPTATFCFARPASERVASVSVDSVVADGNKISCSIDPGSNIFTSSPADVITVYDDSQPNVDFSDQWTEKKDKLVVDADFKNKVRPEYPASALELARSAKVTVGARIGPEGGKPQFAWIASSAGNNDLSEFEKAALRAATESTFRPPLADGRPTTLSYKIIYTFGLGPDNAQDIFDEVDLCPLLIYELRPDSQSRKGLGAWYYAAVSAQNADVLSALIGVEDDSGHKFGVRWNGIDLAPSADDPKTWKSSVVFNWSGAPIKFAWIDEVTKIGGKSHPCAHDVLSAEPGAVPYQIVTVGDQFPLAAPQTLSHAAFVDERWPAYPTGADGLRVLGHVTVVSIVDDAGHVREAFVTKSSERKELDVAAVAAAAGSRYKPAPPNSIVMYEATYRFVP